MTKKKPAKKTVKKNTKKAPKKTEETSQFEYVTLLNKYKELQERYDDLEESHYFCLDACDIPVEYLAEDSSTHASDEESQDMPAKPLTPSKPWYKFW